MRCLGRGWISSGKYYLVGLGQDRLLSSCSIQLDIAATTRLWVELGITPHEHASMQQHALSRGRPRSCCGGCKTILDPSN